MREFPISLESRKREARLRLIGLTGLRPTMWLTAIQNLHHLCSMRKKLVTKILLKGSYTNERTIYVTWEFLFKIKTKSA
jgi:hypothetical protein